MHLHPVAVAEQVVEVALLDFSRRTHQYMLDRVVREVMQEVPERPAGVLLHPWDQPDV